MLLSYRLIVKLTPTAPTSLAPPLTSLGFQSLVQQPGKTGNWAGPEPPRNQDHGCSCLLSRSVWLQVAKLGDIYWTAKDRSRPVATHLM
jgi:hypothetical protein